LPFDRNAGAAREFKDVRILHGGVISASVE
jgi:hypothetical protein